MTKCKALTGSAMKESRRHQLSRY